MVHCYNTGSEVVISKGSAKAFDHCQLVHAQWLHIVRLGIGVFLKRVKSKDNIADIPSRVARQVPLYTCFGEGTIMFCKSFPGVSNSAGLGDDRAGTCICT